MQTNNKPVTTNPRKRNNNYSTYYKSKRKRKLFTIEPGMTGFLCTCNFNEKGCITDAYKLLNQFADENAPLKITQKSEVSNTSCIFNEKESDKSDDTDDDEEDISTTLGKEINKLKTQYEVSLTSRKFQVVDTGVKNVIFITSTLSNPLELVTKIIRELDTTKKQYTRFLLRLLPIEVICKAYMDDIKTKASILFEKYFSQEPKTFSIVFHRNSNNNIKRNEIIENLAEIILGKNPGNKADLKNPEIAVIVEVIRGLCLISIAPDYYKYKKYNLIEICNNAKNKMKGCLEVIANKETVEPGNENTDIIMSSTHEVKEYIEEPKISDTQVKEEKI